MNSTNPAMPPMAQPPKPKKKFWHKVKGVLIAVAEAGANILMAGKGGED